MSNGGVEMSPIDEAMQSHGEGLHFLFMALEAAKAGRATAEDWSTIEHACGLTKSVIRKPAQIDNSPAPF